MSLSLKLGRLSGGPLGVRLAAAEAYFGSLEAMFEGPRGHLEAWLRILEMFGLSFCVEPRTSKFCAPMSHSNEQAGCEARVGAKSGLRYMARRAEHPHVAHARC